MVSRGGFFFLLVVALISFKDVFSNTHHHDEDEHDEKADFRREFGDEDTAEEEHEHIEVREPTSFDGPPKILKDLPTLKFLFCVSCGYRQAFDQFSAFIKEKYPNMNIEGGNYPAVAWKSVLAQFVGFVRIAAMVALIANVNPFERVGVATPSIWLWAQNNKMVACLSFFLICNTLEAPLVSTGAFEIYLGDAQIWSKLESGRVPSPSELAHIIDSQLELTGKAGGLPTQGFQTLQE